MTNLLGVVLAGGLSRRMEGPEKSLLNLNNKPLVAHVVHRLNNQTENIILNANGDTSRFNDLNIPVQKDTIEGYVGPLAGVLAGMRWAKKNTAVTHIITAAADTPFFPKDYISKMLEGLNSQNSDIALAGSNGRKHPVFGLWPVHLADDLEHFLVDEENRKVMLFVQRYSHTIVNFETLKNDIDPFFNVNTPDDMKQAEAISLGLENA